jgi:uncharacterized membrane protein
MPIFAALSPIDWIALGAFLVAWAAYAPVLQAMGRRGNLINTDMTVIRLGWMRRMVAREQPLVDGQIVGNVLNSNSFFASSNLLLIAAAAGVLFNGEESFAAASDLVAIRTSSRALFEVQIALIVVCLARGFLAFIWSIRQLNYCLAAIGAAPSGESSPAAEAYAQAVARLVTPALSSFNSGVRGYYFAMAAAAWLFGPYAFMIATAGAVCLLFWRQRRSRTSAAVAEIRRLLEERDEA